MTDQALEKRRRRNASIGFASFFVFMLLHQADKLLIGPLQGPIMKDFGMTNTQWGLINTGALIVGSVFYPLWGWLYDRFSRPKLLSLASLLWGATTWLNGIAPNFGTFLATRASTGIDDSSYPGIYSLVSDWYPPAKRGKMYGIMQVAQPLGYLIAMVLGLALVASLGWRRIFFVTGSLGIVLSFFIFLFVKDAPRGSMEPELAGVQHLERFKFSWKEVAGLFRKRSLVVLFIQGFIGVFPWNVITYFFFGYLQMERGYDETSTLLTMVPAVLVLAAGYPLGGLIGDRLFKRTLKGRVTVGAAGVLAGAVLLVATMSVPLGGSKLLFGALLAATALFIPFAAPNVLSSFFDVTEPEIRATTNAVQNFIESIGSALAPLVAGIVADRFSIGSAILWICTITWALCFVAFAFAGKYIPKDIEDLRAKLSARAASANAG